VIAHLEVVVEGARVVRLSALPPLSAKVLDGPDGPELLVVGAAASLLERDRLTVTLRLGHAARLTVRTAAATLAHPCPGGGDTTFDVRADLGEGARLAWLPEPLVACAGCRHRGRSVVRLARGAAAVWSESVALGRTGEAPGHVDLRFDAEHEGAALLRDGLRVGPSVPGWAGPAVTDGMRHVGSVALLGVRPPEVLPGDGPHVLALAGPGAVVRAVASDAAAVERCLGPVRRAFVRSLAHAAPPVVNPKIRTAATKGSSQEMVM
jgi:urease accessory protein